MLRRLLSKIGSWAGTLFVIVIALAIRYFVSLGPYSGYDEPPKFGDFEAHRHWMEITFHTPVRDWYRQTENNPLDYWGMDYPPLCAYFEWMLAHIASRINPKWIALGASRGFESHELKAFMRLSVMAMDLLVLIPAILLFFRHVNVPNPRPLFIAMTLFSPALILIDNGHFQFNNVMLGLMLWALVLARAGRPISATVALCSAVSFKQMALYFGPAFLAHFLGICFRVHPRVRGLKLFMQLSLAALLTFAAIFSPWLRSLDDIASVVSRIFPVGRGLFEDKVASFWCTLDILTKFRLKYLQSDLLRMSLLVTLASILPVCLKLCFTRRPSLLSMLYSLSYTSLCFFLFSYHVHEKTILLPLMPVLLLSPSAPHFAAWFAAISAFSLFPLLKRDGLTVPYAMLMAFWQLIFGSSYRSCGRLWRMIIYPTYFAMIVWHVAEAFVAPSRRYPDLYLVLNTIGCSGLLALCLPYLLYQSLRPPIGLASNGKSFSNAGSPVHHKE